MSGRHFLQIPGPTNVPDRILRAMDRPVIDHRGPDLPAVVEEAIAGLKRVFGTTRGEIVIYPSSGTGATEASLVNTLNPGDRVLAFNIGHFSHLYNECARKIGAAVDELDLPWDGGVPADVVQERLSKDTAHQYRAVMLVHNETSNGATTDLAAIRQAIDAARHPALLLVDMVSSAASIEVQFDAWGIDVGVTGAQKGLMLPPGAGDSVRQPARDRGRGQGHHAPLLLRLAAGARGDAPRVFPVHARDAVAVRTPGVHAHARTKKASRTSTRVTAGSPRVSGARSRRWGSRFTAGVPPSIRTPSP